LHRSQADRENSTQNKIVFCCYLLAAPPPIRHGHARKRIHSEIVGIAAHGKSPTSSSDPPRELTLTADEERIEIPVKEAARYGHEVEDFAEGILQKRTLSLAETQWNAENLDRLLAAKCGLSKTAKWDKVKAPQW